VKISPPLYNIAIEARGATFETAKCHSTRTNSNGATLVIPSSITENIAVACAWGKSYAGGVRVSTPFVFEHRQIVELDNTNNVLVVA
jgi:hypothetical protein